MEPPFFPTWLSLQLVSLPGNPCSLRFPRAWARRVIWGSQHNLPLPLRRTALVKTIGLNRYQIIIMANLVECYLSSSVPNALCVLSHHHNNPVKKARWCRVSSRVWALAIWSQTAWVCRLILFLINPVTLESCSTPPCVSVSPSIKWE